MQLKYRRILLKLSGEALAGDAKSGIDHTIVTRICESIAECVRSGAQIAVVVGGGNFWRGRQSEDMDRTRADHMGMLATVINALALADGLERQGLDVRVQTAVEMRAIAEPYIRARAVRHLEKGRVVVFGCGTGSPFFSTDTASALRAAEIEADAVFKATMVDGVYDRDPHHFPDAVRYDSLTFHEALEKELAVMDLTAFTMCQDNHLPVLVFSIDRPENIAAAVRGEAVGTLVHV